MDQITELERRIAAALDRIGLGLETLALSAASAPQDDGSAWTTDEPVDETGGEAAAEIARLTEELAAERAAAEQTAEQTQDKLRRIREREFDARAALQAENDRLTRALDEQGLEMQRIRNLVVQLREQVRQGREAAEEGLADPGQINRAILLEVEALRATRAAEVAEMDGILAELAPLVAAAEAAHAEGTADA